MDWNKRYWATGYVRSSLWFVPVAAIVAEFVFAHILRTVDDWLGWTLLGLAAPGAGAMLQTVITLCLSFIVFTFGSILVAIQVASGQLTPRIIATTLLRDNVVRFTVGLMVFTMLFAVGTFDRLDKEVHQLAVFTAGLLGLCCMVAFLFLIDYAAKMLRPVSVLARVGDAGKVVIDSVYPAALGEPPAGAGLHPVPGAPVRIIPYRGRSGIVLAVNMNALVSAATAGDGMIEVIPSVGDFVATDQPLFALHRNASRIDERSLPGAVAFGPERTLEQDPAFAFRILVDIALKALSPAINDSTTAVLALDQIHRLLRTVGTRELQTKAVCDAAGCLRVVLRTPTWDDFVHLAFSEVRRCGAGNLQVARRMCAMIQNLVQTLPQCRHPALRQQGDLLDRSVRAEFRFAEDLALAQTPDSQGLGGPGLRAA